MLGMCGSQTTPLNVVYEISYTGSEVFFDTLKKRKLFCLDMQWHLQFKTWILDGIAKFQLALETATLFSKVIILGVEGQIHWCTLPYYEGWFSGKMVCL